MSTTDDDQPLSFTDHLARRTETIKRANRATERAIRERDRLVLVAIEDAAKRAWIEAGLETRQPPEYRGRVWDHPDRDGVHPTAFPPLREGAGGELTEAFMAFQAYNQTRVETHPQYYCTVCRIRYNARDGGMCGPCLAERDPTADSIGRSRRQTAGPRYPT